VDMQCRAFTHLAGKARISFAAVKFHKPRRTSHASHARRRNFAAGLDCSRIAGATLAATMRTLRSCLARWVDCWRIGRGAVICATLCALFSSGIFPLPTGARLSRHITDPERRALAKKFLNLLREEAVPRFPLLRRSVIYGDANDHNALVDPRTKRVIP